MPVTDAKIITVPAGELQRLLNRALNTLEPVNTPKWAQDLAYTFGVMDGMPADAPIVLIFAKPE